jgi:hypothetical protein
MDGRPDILTLLHAVSCATSIDEAKIAFALLAAEDLQAAKGLAEVLIRAIPQTAPVWAAVLDGAREQGVTRAKPKSFRWGQRDAQHTADKIAARMGWRDIERR